VGLRGLAGALPFRGVPDAGMSRRSRSAHAGPVTPLLERLSRVVVGYQRWDEVLFVHWPVSPASLRGSVDPRLQLDLFDGQAWLTLTPFTVRGARLRVAPPLSRPISFHELNLRTYVRLDGGRPGVWFFSLDAASPAASAVARAALGLPYFVARVSRTRIGPSRTYRSRRVTLAARPATVDAAWEVGPALPPRLAGSLESFLVDREALYSRHARRILRVRVSHPRWALHEARVERLTETASDAAGLPPARPPFFTHASPGVDVEFFPPELVA
jgi:uncharacterized protein YqjF (DUF2071 family)